MSSKLENRDFTVAIDRSGSMSLDNGNGMNRWKAAGEGAVALANKAAGFDPDGIQILLFGSNVLKFEDQTPDKVAEIFQEYEPMGSTNLTAALDIFFSGYFERKKTGNTKENGEIGIFITDGAPNDQKSAAASIINASKMLDNDQELGLTFVQVGNDSGATSFLQYLDDDLEKMGAKFDIVDTIKIDECENRPLVDVLLGAIED